MRFVRRNLGLLLSVIAFLLIVVLGSYELIQRSRPVRPDTVSGTLAFRTNRDANFEIYTWTVTERKATRLTNNPEEDQNPAFSTDGRLLAYETWSGGQSNIVVADAASGVGGVITVSEANETEPAWQPNSNILAYVSDASGTPSLYLMDFSGDNVRRLTGDAGADTSPSWSPDGRRLVFTSNRAGSSDLYILDLTTCQAPAENAGTTPETCTITPLLVDGAENLHPDWSPDGNRIAFASTREGGQSIYTVNQNGRRIRRITEGMMDSEPAWSVEGGRIAYTTTLPSGETAIQVYDLARRETETITTSGEAASQSAWRPGQT